MIGYVRVVSIPRRILMKPPEIRLKLSGDYYSFSSQYYGVLVNPSSNAAN